MAIAIIAGKVLGNIVCTEFLEIESTGIIEGDLSYNIIEIHAGAEIKGQLIKLTKAQTNQVNKK